MNTRPGWYPDPGGQPGQRHSDGRCFPPTPPVVQVPTATAVAGSGATVRTARRRPLIALEVFGGLVLIDSVIQHPWLLSVVAVIGVLAGAGFWALKSAQHRAEHESDPRGVHGHYLPTDYG